MKVDDDAARGREAALKVRRSKKRDRQVTVRELEERMLGQKSGQKPAPAA